MIEWHPKNEKLFRLIFWPLFIGAAILVLWVVDNPLVYKNPKTAVEYYWLAKGYDQRERLDEEEYCILKSLQLDPHSYKALMMAGVLYHRQGQHVRARKMFEQALAAVDPGDKINHAALLFDLASCYLAEQDAGRAWEYFQKARDMNVQEGAGVWGEQPADPTYWVVQGDRVKFEEALKVHYSSHFGGYLGRVKSKRPAEALKMADAYIQSNPGSIYSQFLYPLRVEALVSLGRREEAVACIRDVEGGVANDGVRLQLKRYLLKVLSDKKEYGHALVVFDEIMALTPASGVSGGSWAKFRADRAGLLFQAGQVKEAVAGYRSILDSFANGHTAFSGQVVSAQEELLRLLLIERKYTEAYGCMVLIVTDIRYVMMTVLNAFFIAGLVWLVLRLACRLFFRRRYKEIRSGMVKLWHLFVLLMGAVFLGEWCVPLLVSLNYFASGLITSAGVDLFLGGLILNSGLMAYAAWVMGTRIYGWTAIETGLVFNGWSWLGRWVLIGLAASGLLLVVGLYAGVFLSGGVPEARSWVEVYLSKLSMYSARSIFWMTVIVLAIPIGEEIFFRMFLFRFLKTFMNGVVAVLVVAAVFMLGHLSGAWYRDAVYAGLSLLWSWLYIRSGSLYPGMIVHMLVNLAGLLLMILM